MEIVDIFKQSIAVIKLNEDLNKLCKYCLSIKQEQKSRSISNVGGFHSEDIQLNSLEIKSLCKNITNYSNIFFKDVMNNKENIGLDNLWININEYKDYNLIHNHPFSKISGVFYVKAPEKCGNIVFSNNSDMEYYIRDKSISIYNNYNSSIWSFPALENILYLFPSWLKHYVEPNLSNESRISISFNLN